LKIGIYTTALGSHISGGILCIVETLNALIRLGHECCCFVDDKPYRSDWLKTDFPVLPSDEIDSFDGILVSPYSPTAERVAFAKNADERFYWVHTNESLFCHNGPEWQDQARRSYHLPLKIFCTSTYVQILMETVFNRYVIGALVPPGIDPQTFFPSNPLQNKDVVNVGMLHRPDWVRGHDVAVLGMQLAQRTLGKHMNSVVIGPTSDRRQMANRMRSLDIFIDPSRVAGSPTPVKEAMACGAIPICTKYGTTDFVLDGYNGRIIPPDNIMSLSNQIVSIANLSYEKRCDIASQAAEYVKQFSWDHIAMRFESALGEGINRGDELLKTRNWNEPK